MMTEELEKEVEAKGVEYADKQKRTISVHEDSGYSWGQVEQAYEKGALDYAKPLIQQNEKMKSLLKEIYEEFGFGELVKIRNDLPTEIQEIIGDVENA